MDTKEFRAFARSHRFVTLLTAVGFVVIAIVIFEAGVFVGFHRASFAYGWEQNYGRDFGDPRNGMGLPDAGVPNGHGADGRVVSVSPSTSTFVVVGDNEAEKTILIGSSTIIRAGRDSTSTSALTTGSYVVVIGDPDASGTVAAELIRILPPPADAQSDLQTP